MIFGRDCRGLLITVTAAAAGLRLPVGATPWHWPRQLAPVQVIGGPGTIITGCHRAAVTLTADSDDSDDASSENSDAMITVMKSPGGPGPSLA